MTVELIQGLLLAFALVVILMPPYIRLLRAIGFGKQIRDEGPGDPPRQARHADDGRPADHRRRRSRLFLLLARPPEAATSPRSRRWLSSGCLGAFDDYLNARTGEGIRVRQKLMWQVVSRSSPRTRSSGRTTSPDRGAVRRQGAIDARIYVLFAAFAIVAAGNGIGEHRNTSTPLPRLDAYVLLTLRPGQAHQSMAP